MDSFRGRETVTRQLYSVRYGVHGYLSESLGRLVRHRFRIHHVLRTVFQCTGTHRESTTSAIPGPGQPPRQAFRPLSPSPRSPVPPRSN